MPLSLLLCPGDGSLFDRVIETAEGGSTIVHIALDLGTGLACEDVWPMLRLVPITRYGATVRRVPLTILSTEQEQAITAYLMARVGTARYDLFQLPADLAGDLTHRWIDSPWHDTRAVCSAVVMESLASVGVAPFSPRDPATLQPSDVASWCDAGLPLHFGPHAATPPEPSVAVAVTGDAGTTLVTLPAGSTVVTGGTT